jgi:NCS2 family nucleobase:cation symporter-2/xanthine permease XanP
VAALFGAYDPQPLLDASWAGVPSASAFPGFDFTPGAEFWALLPVFVVITLVGGIKNIGDSVAMQGASRRRPRVTDFRLAQASLNTNGLGIFFSGIAGTPPTTVFSSTSVSLATLTGVASRNVGYVIGAAFVVLALFPKLPALVLTIPSPVMGAFLLTAIALIFVGGIRTVIQGGLDAQKMLVVGISFSLGAGIETQTIFQDLVGGTWGKLLDNGLLIGALTAIVLTLFLDLTSPRKGGRMQAKLHVSSLPEIDSFVQGIGASLGWNESSRERLRSAAEETLMSLLPEGDEADADADEAPRLIVVARTQAQAVEMEFLAVFDEENLEDRLAYLDEESEGLQEGEISLRLLRHYASSVHHQKYYGLDVVTVQVKGSR